MPVPYAYDIVRVWDRSHCDSVEEIANKNRDCWNECVHQAHQAQAEPSKRSHSHHLQRLYALLGDMEALVLYPNAYYVDRVADVLLLTAKDIEAFLDIYIIDPRGIGRSTTLDCPLTGVFIEENEEEWIDLWYWLHCWMSGCWRGDSTLYSRDEQRLWKSWYERPFIEYNAVF